MPQCSRAYVLGVLGMPFNRKGSLIMFSRLVPFVFGLGISFHGIDALAGLPAPASVPAFSPATDLALASLVIAVLFRATRNKK